MKKININTISLYLAKAFLALYMVYNVFLVPIEIFIPRLSIGLLFMASILTFIGVKRIRIVSEIKILSLFILFSFLTGLVVAVDSGVLLGQVLFLFESVWAGFLFLNIVNNIEEFRFFTLAYTLGALAVGAYCVLNPDLLFTVNGRVTLGEDFNANTLGVILMFGAWSTVFALNSEKIGPLRLSVTFLVLIILLYVIILSASRKAVFGYAVIVMAYFLQMMFNGSSKTRRIIRIIGLPLLVAVAIIVYNRFSESFIDASEMLIKRMDVVDEGLSDRQNIIRDSWRVFTEHPIFGVGLDNNRYHTVMKLYAHNSYLEILACTGIFGAIIFFSLYFEMIGYLIRYAKKLRIVMQQPVLLFSCVLIVVYLFIGYGQIHMYNQNLMFMMYFIFALIGLDDSVGNRNKSHYILHNGK